jgi:O-antigen/teichoic acid export membrane protein
MAYISINKKIFNNNLWNIVGSYFFKLINLIISFLFVPLLLNSLNNYNYGLWITITSFLGWFGIFDFGIGHGLKNKLIYSLGLNDLRQAKVYVSTAYYFTSIIFTVVIFIFIIIVNYIDWDYLFNISINQNFDIYFILTLLFFSICIQIILKLVLVILASYQKFSYIEAVNTFLQIILLSIVFLLISFVKFNFLNLTLVYSIIPIIYFIGLNIYLFNRKFFLIKPSLSYINHKEFNSVGTLGFKFFILQIASIIIYSTDNLLISHYFSPSSVSQYSIPYKYFSIITILFSVILNYFWVVIAKYLVENNITRIKKVINKLIIIWCISIFVGILMILFSKFIFHFWFNNTIFIPFKLVIVCFLYVIIMAWCNIFSIVTNAYSKIKIQVLVSVFLMIINIPVCILLIEKFNMGIEAIPFGGILCMLIGAIISPIQVYKLINNKSTGIWDS